MTGPTGPTTQQNLTHADRRLASILNIDIQIPSKELEPITQRNMETMLRDEQVRVPSIMDSIETETKTDLDYDYEEVRRNLKTLMAQTESAVQNLLQVAEEGGEPRSYEVVADLIRTSLEANKNLIQLHDGINKIKNLSNTGKAAQTAENITNNNIIYNGTTNDFLQALKANDMLVRNKPSDYNIIDEKKPPANG
jgi:hypothetical protein